MKSLFAVITVLFSLNVFAMDLPGFQFANKSDWAKGKVKKACKNVEILASDVGVKTMATSTSGKKAYVYTVYSQDGEKVAQAAAYSDSLRVKATCQ